MFEENLRQPVLAIRLQWSSGKGGGMGAGVGWEAGREGPDKRIQKRSFWICE